MWAELAGAPLLYLRAGPAVVVAAWRVRSLERRCDFDEMVERLRRSSTGRSRPALSAAAARVAGRLLPLLPPAGMGPCLKRSLILLHLWSGWGLQPRLHMGMRAGQDGPEGHAWLTVDDPNLEDLAGSPGGCEEAMVL